MRFVIVGPVYPYRGGIAHYTSRMAQAARDEGHVVKVISFARQYPRFLYPGKSDRDPSQEVIRVDAEYILDPLYPWTWEKAIKEIHKFSPEVVVIQWWTTFWAPAFGWISYRLRNHIKVAFLIHNVVPHEARFFDPWLAKLVLRQGNKHIVQSESQRQRLKELLPKADPVFIEHPLYDQFAEKRMSKEEARRRLGLPEDRPVLLFFGIVRPYKGLTNLIEALALVYQEGYSPLLIVAGEFWEDVELYKRRIQELGLQEAVRIYNYYIPNEEVPVFFSAADVFVAPYTGGTQSGALKIALAFGLPVVASEGISIRSNTTLESGKKLKESSPSSISESIVLYLGTLRSTEIDNIENLSTWSKLVEHILYANG